MDFVRAIEHVLGQKADCRMLPTQAGDPMATAADTTLLQQLIGPLPRTPMEQGVARFVSWYRNHYQI